MGQNAGGSKIQGVGGRNLWGINNVRGVKKETYFNHYHAYVQAATSEGLSDGLAPVCKTKSKRTRLGFEPRIPRPQHSVLPLHYLVFFFLHH